jgi:hypothetical protein
LRATHGKTSPTSPTSPNFWFETTIDNYLRARTVLAGPHGSVPNELFRMIANLKHMQPAQLIGYVQSIDWTAIDYNTKLVVVHECNSAITAYREKHNLEPIDDNLPGDVDTPFRTIKAIVLIPSPHTRAPTEAKLGLSNQ